MSQEKFTGEEAKTVENPEVPFVLLDMKIGVPHIGIPHIIGLEGPSASSTRAAIKKALSEIDSSVE